MMQAPTKQMQPQYEITEADRKRQEQIARVWQAFDDDLELPLVPMPDEDPETANVAENVVASTVEDIIGFLFGDELEIRVGENDPKEAQQALDDTWGIKETRLPLLQELAQNGLMSGQAFLRIVPETSGDLRLLAIDPATIFVQHMPGDCKTVLLYCIEYCVDETINGHPMQRYYREEIRRLDPENDDPDVQNVAMDRDTTWEISHWTRLGEKGRWEAIGDPYVWPYSFSPVQSCQNLVRANRFWGRADTPKGLIALNKNINFALSNINKIGKLYAQPVIWVTGARMPTIEMGRAVELPVEATLGALEFHSDLPSQILFQDKLHGVLERTTSVPALASGVTQNMPHGPISGIALKTMCMALLKKIDKKRCLYGALLINVSKAILQIKGFSPDIKITLHWQDPLPQNLLEDLQAAVLQEQVGFSRDTIIRRLGGDPEHEAEMKKQEATQKNVDYSRGQGLPPAPDQMMQLKEEERG
jgi:hypothetical protein